MPMIYLYYKVINSPFKFKLFLDNVKGLGKKRQGNFLLEFVAFYDSNK
jgi:hypothetical protein